MPGRYRGDELALVLLRSQNAPRSGVLSTAGGLVFSGDGQGNFIALDAENGHDLWHIQLGAPIVTADISYAIDGKQYVTITAGQTVYTLK